MNDFESNLKKALNDRVDERVGPRRNPPAFDALRSATRRNGAATSSRWLIPLMAAAAVAAVAIGASAVVNATSTTHRVAPAIPRPVKTDTLQRARHTATTPRPTTPPPTTVPPRTTAPATNVPEAASPSHASASGLPGAPPCQPDVRGANVPGSRPSLIFIGCATSADMLIEISWSSWTRTGATGKATHGINDCKPSCAQGTYTYFPVNVRLSHPARVKGMLVFETIVMSPTSRVGRPETVTEHNPPYGMWGWSP